MWLFHGTTSIILSSTEKNKLIFQFYSSFRNIFSPASINVHNIHKYFYKWKKRICFSKYPTNTNPFALTRSIHLSMNFLPKIPI